MIILTIKQLKRRIIQGMVEPELAYMPWGKKEFCVDYIRLDFKELAYSNYDEILSEYPEYADELLKRNKYRNTLVYGGNTEAVLFTENYKPLCKISFNYNYITLKNIPYGIYHLKMIKSNGYILQEYTIIVDKNSNQKTYILELQRSYISVEIGIDNGNNTADIYEQNSYDEKNMYWQSPWLFDHILSCESSGRVYYKYYTCDGKYLGKTVWGFSTYDSDVITSSTYCYFKYFPTHLTSQHITGNYTFGNWDYLATNTSRPVEYIDTNIGKSNSINMPLISKYDNAQLTVDISFIPNRPIVPERTDTISKTVSYDYQLFEVLKKVYIPIQDNPTEKQLIGYNYYFEDEMNSEIYSNIVNFRIISSRWQYNPVYLYINQKDKKLYGYGSLAYDYNACKKVNENTIAYYHNYPNYSDDCNNYDDIKVYSGEYEF